MAISDSQRLMSKRILAKTEGRLLRRGSTGVTVRALQAFLADQGFDVGKLDGKFGKRTQGALKAFQKANALAVDGKAGTQTLGKMREMFPDLAEPVATADLPPDSAPELPKPESPMSDLAPEMAAEDMQSASMPGVSSPPESIAPQPPLPPDFSDEMFSEAKPDLPQQYSDAERSDGLAGLIDGARSSMTGTPESQYAASRHFDAPQEWQAQPGDGLDPLRQALLGKVMQQQGAPQAQPVMTDLMRALAMGR